MKIKKLTKKKDNGKVMQTFKNKIRIIIYKEKLKKNK